MFKDEDKSVFQGRSGCSASEAEANLRQRHGALNSHTFIAKGFSFFKLEEGFAV